VRCAFRVAELRDGFESPLANDEAAFMVLEGSMIITSCLCLTIGHPGLCLDTPWKLPGRLTQKRSNDNSGIDIEINTHK
jgi:hypothetical protein